MTDLTKLTVDRLRAEILIPENGVTFAEATNELARRAQANDLVQAERDEFDEELHTCRAIVRATSEHLHVDLEEMVDKLRRTEADAHSWQELATARAQANDALRSAALNAAWNGSYLADGKDVWEVPDRHISALRSALAAAPAPSSSGAPAPVDFFESHLFHTDDGMPSSRCRVCGAVYKDAGFVPCKPEPAACPECDGSGTVEKCDPPGEHANRYQEPCPRGCKPAPADSQREAAIEKAIEDLMAAVEFDVTELDDDERSDDTKAAIAKLRDLMRHHIADVSKMVPAAPPAPVAPVTDAEVEAAMQLYRDAAVSVGADGDGYGRMAEDGAALRAMIARRVAEARGAGLRELRAWVQMTASTELFGTETRLMAWLVRPNDMLAEIDRLLAAPAASKLAEEPAGDYDPEAMTNLGKQIGRLLAKEPWREKMRVATNRMVDAAGYAASSILNDVDIDLKDVRDFAFALREQVESQARRIEALENNKEAGK